MVVKNREGDFCCFMCYYYTNLYLVVVVALSGAVFDVHYHSAHAKKLVCSATGVYAPKCHQNASPMVLHSSKGHVGLPRVARGGHRGGTEGEQQGACRGSSLGGHNRARCE